MDIAAFRDIGRVANGHVLADVVSDGVKVRRQTFLNRAVDWIRAKVSPNPLATAQRDAAHNRFLTAIAQSPAYDDGDVSRAEALLSADLVYRRPLSTRRVREVIADLDGRSTQAERDNRTTVAWMSTRGLNQALRERTAEGDAAAASLSEEDRTLLGARIGETVRSLSSSGLRKLGFAEASAATQHTVDAFLAEKAASARAAEQAQAAAAERTRVEARAPEPSSTGTQEVAPGNPSSMPVPDVAATIKSSSAPVPGSPAPPSVSSTASVPEPAAPASAVTAQDTGPPRLVPEKELRRALAKAGLPKALRPELKRLVKSGAIVDEAGLARRTNRFVADWVMENRVGRWYGEALRSAGARGRIKNGEQLMAPSGMLDEVRRSIADSPTLLAYADVKRQARALVAEHVRSETDGRV